jgi:putative transposase
MPMGRPKMELNLSADELQQLQSIARSRSMPAALTLRAKLVLACAEGTANSAVAQRHGVSPATVGKWRRRFIERRLLDCMTNCVQVSRGRSMTSGWRR